MRLLPYINAWQRGRIWDFEINRLLEACASEAGQRDQKQWVFFNFRLGRSNWGWNQIPEFSFIIFESDIE